MIDFDNPPFFRRTMRPIPENPDNDEKRRGTLHRLPPWAKAKYWLAILPALVLIAAGWFVPEYQPNEPGRVVSMRQFLDPSFPAPDWLQVAGYDEDRLTIGFKALLAPLWVATKNPIYVALAGRLVVWAFLLSALVRLVRAMELPPYAVAWGVVLWIGFGQSLGAHEWLFNGVEGKCLAYALLMLALEATLRQRLMLAAFFCGLSWWFHVPVAAWGTLAICGALALRFREYGFKRLLKFGFLTAALLLPMVIVALKYTGSFGLVGSNSYADWIVVVFRNPHHLDPNYFHGGSEFLRLSACAAVGAAGFYVITSRSKAGFLSAFLGILLLEFGVGLVARQLNLFWYLKTYPFRIADVLVLLFSWLALPGLVVGLASRLYKGNPSVRSVLVLQAAGIAMLLAVSALCLLRGNPQDGRYGLRTFTQSWIRYAKHTETPYYEMIHWIRANTPKSATIITGAWDGDFWLEAERAEVVNFKRNPHNALAIEWYRRYSALNGGPFHGIGFPTRSEIKANFPSLSQERLDEIRKLYGGNYYLTTKARSDLRAQLAHENGSYYLYVLSR
jgi:hypothetical protein